MRRSRFLPIFFTALTITFVIVLVIRLRSEMRQPATATIAAPQAATTATQSIPETMTLQSVATSSSHAAARPKEQQSQDGRKPLPHGLFLAPNASAPAAHPHQSAFARVFAPILKALRGGKTSSPAPRPAGGGSSTPQTSQSSSTSTSTRSPERETSKDPNSDSTPPQLLSIEFTPPQVHDGEEATVIVTAVDDLSGVRSVSGTISSPTGKALQGFATQRDGETNRYVGRVIIAKDAEEGLWKVNFLNMSDNASNAVTLSYAQGSIPPSAVLRVVSSNSDSTPPTLKNIWVDRRAIRGGEKDILYVEAFDDKSGVNLVSAVFQSPSKLARIGAGCQHSEGDIWQCELTIPTCVDCGDWQLEQVTLQDKANNLATFRMDNPLVAAVKINITGDACDNTPPVLQSLLLDNRDIDLSHGGAVVMVTVMATDDNCGVAGVSGQYVGPGAGSGGFFPLQQSGDANTWTGRIQLDARSARGTWRINSIQLNDRGHNLRVYYATDPLLANGVFRVR
jgi:hypothetical protein